MGGWDLMPRRLVAPKRTLEKSAFGRKKAFANIKISLTKLSHLLRYFSRLVCISD